MHHKFLVFGRLIEPHERPPYFKPQSVWTGSFNLSDAATTNVENAVFIENEEIAAAYHCEFGQVYMISEELNWSSELVKPDYRHADYT